MLTTSAFDFSDLDSMNVSHHRLSQRLPPTPVSPFPCSNVVLSLHGYTLPLPDPSALSPSPRCHSIIAMVTHYYYTNLL